MDNFSFHKFHVHKFNRFFVACFIIITIIWTKYTFFDGNVKNVINDNKGYNSNFIKYNLQDVRNKIEPRKPPIRFKSYIYPFGINENLITPPLTIKSIRKLGYDEYKIANYEENSPYEVEVKEEIEYEDGVSHLIWFYANADYEDQRPSAFIRNTPIVYYFLSNLRKKVKIPLLNKVLVNNHTTYSIKGTNDVLQTIKHGESNPYFVKKAQIIASRFESFLYQFGINENLKTPPLTIKSIRKLKDDEHKLVNYKENSPYEVEVEEEIEYENGVSHLIWFFANADYEDKRPASWISNTPIVYYFLSNLGEKVEIPLLNKVLVNSHTTYSVKGTKDVLQTIEDGKSDADLVEKSQNIENE
ncbi:21051_t:CDS:1 [Cetraspora pellucida]|uniref:21051_t:CDS:1 n=1 Tax=Cetraspora pellucida TaxID=1433469 RepID=A0A9N9NMJ4_9GLOM|nr:21051_t:CDS:1 [Cetraspora pellucida]